MCSCPCLPLVPLQHAHLSSPASSLFFDRDLLHSWSWDFTQLPVDDLVGGGGWRGRGLLLVVVT
jgi:hypothetical protein